jgi:hypothetical protein
MDVMKQIRMRKPNDWIVWLLFPGQGRISDCTFAAADSKPKMEMTNEDGRPKRMRTHM